MEEVPSVRSESFISSIYSYIALSDNPSGGKGTSPEDQEAIRYAKACVVDCDIHQLISDSKFLHTDALQEFIRGTFSFIQLISHFSFKKILKINVNDWIYYKYDTFTYIIVKSMFNTSIIIKSVPTEFLTYRLVY